MSETAQKETVTTIEVRRLDRSPFRDKPWRVTVTRRDVAYFPSEGEARALASQEARGGI